MYYKSMDMNKKNRGALPMLQLTFPLAMEQIFRVLVSTADTLMLSGYDNSAAAGVAVTAQYVFFLNLMTPFFSPSTYISIGKKLNLISLLE